MHRYSMPCLEFASKLPKKPLAIFDGLDSCKHRWLNFKLAAKLISQRLSLLNQRFNLIKRDTRFLKCIIKIQV